MFSLRLLFYLAALNNGAQRSQPHVQRVLLAERDAHDRQQPQRNHALGDRTAREVGGELRKDGVRVCARARACGQREVNERNQRAEIECQCHAVLVQGITNSDQCGTMK